MARSIGLNQTRPTYLFSHCDHPNPKKVAAHLIDGVDISLVDPQIFPYLREPLSNMKFRYASSNEDKIVEKIDFILDYIAKYPERRQLSDNLIGPPKTVRVKPPPFTRQELNKEVEDIFQNDVQKQYTAEEFEQIIAEIRRRRGACISKKDFENALLYNKRLESTIQRCENQQTLNITQESVETMKGRVVAAERSYADMKVRWQHVLRNFEADKEKGLAMLEREQNEEYNKELSRLESKKPKTLAQTSSQLLEMRRMENSFINVKDFKNARLMKDKIDEREEMDKCEFVEKWSQANKAALKELCRKQDRVYAIKVQNFKRDEEKLKEDMAHELNAAKARIESLRSLLKKNEMMMMSIDPSTTTFNNSKKNTLPSLRLKSNSCEASGNIFRQRALINRRIYTRHAPKTARPFVRH